MVDCPGTKLCKKKHNLAGSCFPVIAQGIYPCRAVEVSYSLLNLKKDGVNSVAHSFVFLQPYICSCLCFQVFIVIMALKSKCSRSHT